MSDDELVDLALERLRVVLVDGEAPSTKGCMPPCVPDSSTNKRYTFPLGQFETSGGARTVSEPRQGLRRVTCGHRVCSPTL
ncbi:hypothetical protein GCM10027194_22920 [Thalassiella azotivora]